MQAKQLQQDVKLDNGLATPDVKPCKKCGSTDRYPPTKERKTGRCIPCWRERSRKNGTSSTTASTVLYQKQNPKKYRAHYKVRSAIKAGKLPKVSTLICIDCNKAVAQCYHHEDYEKPLDVVALCQACHMKRHAS